MSLKVPIGPHDHELGRADAPLTLLEFGDFECPYCIAAHPTVQALLASMGDRLRFVFRHMPLGEVHPHAELAAEAAEAAGAQGQFWEMHDALFERHAQLGPELTAELARRLQLDMVRFDDDLSSRRFRDHVKRDFLGAIRSGVPGTPAFFIANELYVGSIDEQSLAAALQGLRAHA
jgi:protein-disulfide isomerase